MTIRFVSQGVEWNEPMRMSAFSILIEPLRRRLSLGKFEISLYLVGNSMGLKEIEPGEDCTLWAVLQTFDRRANEVVRCQGREFTVLLKKVTEQLEERLERRSTSGWWPKFLSLRSENKEHRLSG